MDTSTKSITITDLDHKINGKIGIPKGKREKYTQLMTQALLTDGMTRQNQVRFCNVFVATGVSPVIELLKSEKGKDWHSIVVSLMKLDYFIKFSRMRLRFFMDLFSWSLYTQLPTNQKVLVYSIENIKKMEIAEKGKFRIENIGLFKGYILDRWKSNELIRLNLNDKVLLGLKNFVLHCLKEDKKDLLKNHPHLKDFFNWINGLSEKNKKAATVKNESVDKNKKPAGNENTEEKSWKTANKVVLTLQDVIDQFEQKIIQRNSEITMLNGEITRLKNLNEEIRKNFQNTIAKLEDDLKNEKLNSINSTKDLKNKVLVLQENLKQSEELIEEQKAKLQERDQLLKDNDIRFKNFYKQKMTALGCNLKMSVNDLKESINDLEGDEKDFIETPFEDIIHLLKKEGVDL